MSEKSDKTFDVILDSVADGVFTVDKEWKLSYFNRAAEEITGVPREEAIGKRCCEVFRASICEDECALKQTIETGKPVVSKPIYIINSEGRRIPISISTAILKDEAGRIIGGVETFRDLSITEELRRELEGRYTFEDIVSKNREMLRIFDVLPNIARSESTVLIEGESGTGKELFARAIHNLSARKEKPMVCISCGALPDTLLESELFGHKAGAFTDARNDRPGRFAAAEGGSIFLDEIGDVSPALQARLLRVLQEKVYEPLGSVEPVKTDVRVIAATNKNLSELTSKGSFRQDLYYRINVIRILIPPLRERREDIALLVDHFISRFNRLKGRKISQASPDVFHILMKHDFPGNVRELENIIEHSFVLCRGEMIEAKHLPDYLRPMPGNISPSTPGLGLKALEADFILDALRRNNWNRTATARELGIHKSTLHRKIKTLELDLPKKDGRSSNI